MVECATPVMAHECRFTPAPAALAQKPKRQKDTKTDTQKKGDTGEGENPKEEIDQEENTQDAGLCRSIVCVPSVSGFRDKGLLCV
jgi:hypothetical protein